MENKSFEKKSSVEEKTFRGYVEDLELKPDDFNKVILDVGAGKAHFAKWAKDHGVNSQIYSLEPLQEMAEKEKGLIGSAEEIPMPDKSFDLIVSISAIPNIYLGEKDVKEKVQKSFSEMLRVLKDGGEIRLAHVLMGNKYESQMVLTNSIKEVLQEIQEKHNIEVKKVHISSNDTYEYDKKGNKKNILAESFLIILKKEPNNKLSSSY
jgi:ubiquinone/menaquinone biosynthesis C-methylase UbiE